LTLLILAACGAFGITALLGYPVIPWLRKLKFGQIILDIGPKWHKHKQGTPTMGGMMFIAGIALSAATAFAANVWLGLGLFDVPDIGVFTLRTSREITIKLVAGLIMAVTFGLLGFADDYVKVVKKRNKGLSISQKSVLQILISVGYLYSLYLAMHKSPYTVIPFVGSVHLGWFFWIFGFCVLYATTNAVNFTDGVDGLCSSVTVTAGVALAVIAVMRGLFGAGVLAAAMVGGCAGFLVWNRNPAKVFMGDTGALFLGGLLIAITFALDMPIILLLVGLVYVIEGMSDVIQIGYFKLTHGKRIFRMAPFHHHLERGGWNEKKITLVLSLVNLIGCIAGIAAVWFGVPRLS
jgi:phospho-N-acetylmuramoyl-pentapeptide-transferase